MHLCGECSSHICTCVGVVGKAMHTVSWHGDNSILLCDMTGTGAHTHTHARKHTHTHMPTHTHTHTHTHTNTHTHTRTRTHSGWSSGWCHSHTHTHTHTHSGWSSGWCHSEVLEFELRGRHLHLRGGPWDGQQRGMSMFVFVFKFVMHVCERMEACMFVYRTCVCALTPSRGHSAWAAARCVCLFSCFCFNLSVFAFCFLNSCVCVCVCVRTYTFAEELGMGNSAVRMCIRVRVRVGCMCICFYFCKLVCVLYGTTHLPVPSA
jgi:hypothetical protein